MMARCPECGRKLDAFNSVRFTERECLGFDYTGKKEYQTTSFTVCTVCALQVESGIADGRARAKILAIHKRRTKRGEDAVPGGGGK
jgi:hypothetical protein